MIPACVQLIDGGVRQPDGTRTYVLLDTEDCGWREYLAYHLCSDGVIVRDEIDLAPTNQGRLGWVHCCTEVTADKLVEDFRQHDRSLPDAVKTAIEQAADSDLNEIEHDILEALGKDCLYGKEIAKLAGYAYDGHFREVLSSLVKRKRLIKGHNGHRYRRASAGFGIVS